MDPSLIWLGMPEAHPIELRERVVQAYESGEGTYETIATRFKIGSASVKRWVSAQRRRGDLRPRPKAGGTPSTITLAPIETELDAVPDATAGELTAALNRKRHWRSRVHVSSMKRALHRHGFVVKKSADGRWRVSGRTSSPSGTTT